MSSFEGIARKFTPSVRKRGEVYFDEGRVQDLIANEEGFFAEVHGSEVYEASIREEHDDWHLDCSCPWFTENGPCKHLWALVLAIGGQPAGEAVPSSRRAKIRALSSRRESIETEIDAMLFGDRSRAPAKRKPAALTPVVDARPWQQPIEALEEAARLPPFRAPSTQIRYVLRRFPDDDEGVAQLEIQVAREFGSGVFGDFRTVPFDLDRELGLDPREVERVARIRGAPAFEEMSWTDPVAPERELPAPLQRSLLADLTASGKLHLARGHANPGPPLELDEGPELEFGLTLRREPQSVVLDGFLARAGERIDLGSLDLALEGGLLVHAGRVVRVDWRGAWKWAAILRHHSGIRVPTLEVARVLDVLARVPGSPHLEADDWIDVAEPPAKRVLQLSWSKRRAEVLLAKLAFDFAGRRIERTDPTTVRRIEDRLVRFARDPQDEQQALEQFLAAGGHADDRRQPESEGLVEIADLPRVVDTLTKAGWIVEAEGQLVRTGGGSRVSVTSGIDWFDLEAQVDFGGVLAELPELLRALRDHTRFVRLSDGTMGLLPERWLESWNVMPRLGEGDGPRLRIAKSRAWLLHAWLEGRGEVDVDLEFEKTRERLQALQKAEPRDPPNSFRGELREYQRSGLGWLHFLGEAGLGGCLADDMGLGKTIQVLALLLERRSRARGPSLVVAPRSVLFNWQRESERFAPELKLLLHHGLGRAKSAARLEDVDLVVTSYGTLRQDVEWLSQIQFDCAVLDEAQAIKNETSLAAKCARALQADQRIAMTGTPVENHLGELFSIFEFLNPGMLGKSRALRDLWKGAKDDAETARLAARALKPFLLRRTKDEVLKELPAKTEQIVVCELEGAERRRYDEMRDKFRADLLARADEVGLERMQMNVLEALLRLRQAACHPGLLDPTRVGEGSAKIDALLPMLDEVRESGHKALVFSQFTSLLAIVRARLDAQGIVYEYLDGQTRDREERVTRFQEDARIPLFLISLKAGGFGLNLTAADYVFLLDPWWNPAVESQAIDRTHRIGQTRPVTAYRLVARDTVEEKVLALQEKKRALADALFAGSGASLRDLSREDLEWLLA